MRGLVGSRTGGRMGGRDHWEGGREGGLPQMEGDGVMDQILSGARSRSPVTQSMTS